MIWTAKDFSRYKDFFEKGPNKQVKKRDGSTKKVQFKDDIAHEVELDDIENDDGNVGPTLDRLISVGACTYASFSTVSLCTGWTRTRSLNSRKGASEDAY